MSAQIATYRPGPGSGREQRQPPPEAQRRMMERQTRFFRMADANRDGRITMDELRPMAAALFRGADANGDNVLEKNELPGQRGPRSQQRGPARGRPDRSERIVPGARLPGRTERAARCRYRPGY
ncbi:hypothetical protein ACFQU7_09325 [Pseudoroseomonas wenyumeiae]